MKIDVKQMEGEGPLFSNEFSAALRRGLAECVKVRPKDPCAFLAGKSFRQR